MENFTVTLPWIFCSKYSLPPQCRYNLPFKLHFNVRSMYKYSVRIPNFKHNIIFQLIIRTSNHFRSLYIKDLINKPNRSDGKQNSNYVSKINFLLLTQKMLILTTPKRHCLPKNVSHNFLYILQRVKIPGGLYQIYYEHNSFLVFKFMSSCF